MQVAADGRTLALCFDFTPSIALYIWQSFSKQWPAVQHSDDVLDVWMYASEVCCIKGCTAASMENSLSILLALLSVDPLQRIPVDRLLCDDPSSPPDFLMLLQGEPLIRLLLLFAQLLAAVASELRTILASVEEVDTTMGEVRRVLIPAITASWNS